MSISMRPSRRDSSRDRPWQGRQRGVPSMSSVRSSLCFAACLAAGCGNDLPSLGTCPTPASTGEPVSTPVPLVGHAAYFDDLRFAPELGKVLAAAEGTGRVFVVDPETLETTMFGTSGGTASADADAKRIFVVERFTNRIVAFDAATTARVASVDLDANPDYVRVAPGRS